jgi:hypothetical protein
MTKAKQIGRSVSDQKEIRITQLLDDRARLTKENKLLTARLEDLKQTNALLQSSPVTTPSQAEENVRIRREFDRMSKEESEIGLLLRQNFPDQIAQGRHTGLTLSQVVGMYLGKSKEQWVAGYEAGHKAGLAEKVVQ